MIDLERLHEVVSVTLEPAELRQSSELASCLSSLGFSNHGDLFSLDRRDSVPPWQHASIVEVYVYRSGEVVYDEKGWDKIRLDYLFAFLPVELSDVFIDVAFAVSDVLGVPVLYRKEVVERDELASALKRFSDELMEDWYETPGSEELAILIAGTYPRRK